MSTSVPGQSVPDVGVLQHVARASLWRRVATNPTGALSAVFLLAVLVVSLLAPYLTPQDPERASARDILARPGEGHLLGADGSGHDIFSRLMVATRLSVSAALLALVVAAAIGITTGLIAGYYGRRWEALFSWTSSLLMALPAIVVLLAARAVLGPSIWTAMAIFGVLLAPAFYRTVAAAVSAVRNELYVDAARVFGLSDRRIIGRHILRVVRAPAIILAANVTGIAIAVQAGLDFLGLGDLGRPSWGGMLNDAFVNIYSQPLNLLWPSAAVALTCTALALFGNALRDELERTTRPSRRRRAAAASSSRVAGPGEPTIVHDADARTPSGPALLEVRHLAVGHDQADGSVVTVVHDVSLSVHRGEVHGLIGESGSGKTQTAFAILQLLPPGGRILDGAAELDGVDLAGLGARGMRAVRGARIAYVPQEPMSNLDPSFTIGSQLVEPLRTVSGLSRRAARERAEQLLDRVGIPDPRRTMASYPHQVSGGMAQRVLIAGAVSANPDLLIADEPTTALDVTVQAEVLELLRDLREEFSMGVLLVTHNFGVVADICDRVSVMSAGRVVETGSVRAVFAHPQHEYTRSLFEASLHDSSPREPFAQGSLAQGSVTKEVRS